MYINQIAIKNSQLKLQLIEISSKYKTYGRPYLVAAGYEEGVKYIFTMSSLMTKVIADAEFIQCDITYDNCKNYPYIFNAVAFNKVSMEWMVVARLRLNKQCTDAYSLAFRKLHQQKQTLNQVLLLGVVTDWSDAEIAKWSETCCGSRYGRTVT